MEYNDIELAFTFVGHSSEYGMHTALLCKSTGQICFSSDTDDFNEIPEEAYESDDWIEIPHPHDLDLGRNLVFEFVARRLPSELGRVEGFFHSRGAYRRYKDLLEHHGLLDEWYKFQNEREKQAILEWCRENGIEVTE